MKYCNVPLVIDKRYAQRLRERAEVFRRETGTAKTLFNTFITTRGVARNEYADELATAQVTAIDLFQS